MGRHGQAEIVPPGSLVSAVAVGPLESDGMQQERACRNLSLDETSWKAWFNSATWRCIYCAVPCVAFYAFY